MKKFKLLVTSLFATTMLAACGEKPCEHIDDNKDHYCDLCKEKLSDHADDNHDHLCEYCGNILSECEPGENSHTCDYCGKVFTEHYDNNKDGKCDICDEALPTVTSVKISNVPEYILVEGSAKLAVNVQVKDDAGKDVVWSSSNPDVATVAADGTVTGVSAGQAIISVASSVDGSKFDSVVVKIVDEGIKEIEILDLPEVIGLGEWILLDADVSFYGEEESDFVWSIVKYEGEGDLLLDTDSDGTWIQGLELGFVEVRAVSVDDPSVYASQFIEVIDKGPEPDLYNYGLPYLKEDPSDLLELVIGEGEYDLFVPSENICENGYYFYPLMTESGALVGAELILNIGTYFATEEQMALGYQLMGELDGDENLYYFCDIFNDDANCYMDSTKTYEIDSIVEGGNNDYYFTLAYYRTDALYAGDELTEDEAWPEEASAFMIENFGEELPFVKMGAAYDFDVQVPDPEDPYDDSVTMIMFYDFSTNHEVTDNLGEFLEAQGFTFVKSSWTYQKPLASNPLKSITVESYYTSYGNTIGVYIDNTVFQAFPSDVVNDYVTNTLGSENSVPGFTLSSEEMTDYRFYPATDTADYIKVTGLYATYDEFESYLAAIAGEGYTCVASEFYETRNPEHIYNATFILGKIQLEVSCDPQVEIDWDTFTITTDWDYSTISIKVSDSGLEETAGLTIVSNKEVSARIDDEFDVVAVSYGIDASKLTFTSSDESIATVDENGHVVAKGKGEVTIKAEIVDGETYSDEVALSVNYKVSSDEVVFADLDMSNLGSVVSAKNTSLAMIKAEAESAPEYNDGYVYLPEGSQIVVQLDGDHTASKIEFAAGEGSEIDFTADNGVVVKGAWYADEESGVQNSLVLTVNAGCYISGMNITIDGDLEDIPSAISIYDVASDFIYWYSDSFVYFNDASYYDMNYLDVYCGYDTGMLAEEWLDDDYTLADVLEENSWLWEYMLLIPFEPDADGIYFNPDGSACVWLQSEELDAGGIIMTADVIDGEIIIDINFWGTF